MKWFQHQSAAHTDAKLKKVLMKYGFEGYGLYWYCIESICHKLEPRLTFELEDDSEILAHIGNMDSRNVEDAILYMVNLGLFTESNGVIACRKIARHLGDNLTRNIDLKSIIRAEKVENKHHMSQTVSDSLRLSQQEERKGEEKRGEEKRVIKKKPLSKLFKPPTVQEVTEYVSTREIQIDPENFVDWNTSKGWLVGSAKMKDWKASVRTWEKREKNHPPKQRSSKDTSIEDDITDRSWAN